MCDSQEMGLFGVGGGGMSSTAQGHEIVILSVHEKLADKDDLTHDLNKLHIKQGQFFCTILTSIGLPRRDSLKKYLFRTLPRTVHKFRKSCR